MTDSNDLGGLYGCFPKTNEREEREKKRKKGNVSFRISKPEENSSQRSSSLFFFCLLLCLLTFYERLQFSHGFFQFPSSYECRSFQDAISRRQIRGGGSLATQAPCPPIPAARVTASVAPLRNRMAVVVVVVLNWRARTSLSAETVASTGTAARERSS